jgi:phosphoenolpyruvate synthase/pyruvate phosphate dikinase
LQPAGYAIKVEEHHATKGGREHPMDMEWAKDFDERDPGALEFIRQAVDGSPRNGWQSGICGQAPSDHPEVAEFLVRQGIDSMSLNRDSVLRTTLRVLEIEKELGRSRCNPGVASSSRACS